MNAEVLSYPIQPYEELRQARKEGQRHLWPALIFPVAAFGAIVREDTISVAQVGTFFIGTAALTAVILWNLHRFGVAKENCRVFNRTINFKQ